MVDAIAPRQDAGEPRARRATHFRATHSKWVGRPVRCRVESRATLLRAGYDDPPENRGANGPQCERNDSRVVAAIAPRQDAGEPRARRATHFRATHGGGLDVPSDAQWVGRLVRCRVESRATLLREGYDDPPGNRGANGPQSERNDPRVVAAIAPRQDAGERRARRATHFRATHSQWVGRPVRCRVGWTSRPMQGGVPRHPAPGRSRRSSREIETRTDRNARGTICVWLLRSLPGRMPGSLARDARPTFARPTVVGWASRPMHQWVGRPVRCRVESRATLLRAGHDDPPEKSRRERTAMREERFACGCCHRSPAGCRGASRETRDPLSRDPLPVGWTSRPMQGGLDVSSDAGWSPAPPCSGQVTTILPRIEARTDRKARGTIRVWLLPSLPGRMPGSLARDARPTFARPTDGRKRISSPCIKDSSSPSGAFVREFVSADLDGRGSATA